MADNTFAGPYTTRRGMECEYDGTWTRSGAVIQWSARIRRKGKDPQIIDGKTTLGPGVAVAPAVRHIVETAIERLRDESTTVFGVQMDPKSYRWFFIVWADERRTRERFRSKPDFEGEEGATAAAMQWIERNPPTPSNFSWGKRSRRATTRRPR